VRVNSLGFRGPEIAPVKPANGFRVLFLGDGTTLNNQTAEEETFPFRVGAELQHLHPECRVEILVGAVSGYQLEQYFELLRGRGASLDPDAIVVGFCWNDWAVDTSRGPGLGPAAYGEYAGSPRGLGRLAIADFLERLERVWARRRQARGHARGEDLPDPAADETIWVHADAMLDSIAGRCAATGSRLVLLVLPARMTGHDPAAFAERAGRLRDWAAARGVLYVDPAPGFAAAESRGAQLFLDELHLSRAAQPLVATALLEALLPVASNPASPVRN
jgi:lysophospholipase L1-like esterase